MKPVKQKNSLGCAVACVAFILQIHYREALALFKNGYKNASFEGFLCREIVTALKLAGLEYEYKYIRERIRKRIYKANAIVFLRRSKRYLKGHYLVRSENNKWMDPWLNFPKDDIEAGFRTRLPEKPIYVIFPI